MAIQFASGKWIRKQAANFLNGLGEFSSWCWFRIDTLTTANNQYAWSHRGATNQISLRKVLTTDKIRGSVTCGGVNQVVDSTTTVVAGTWYFVVLTWKPGLSDGLKIYVNGVQEATASTTSQSGTYDSGSSSTDLAIAARTIATDRTVSNPMVGSLENLGFVGKVVTLEQVKSLRNCGWPHLAALRPLVNYALREPVGATRFTDISPNVRVITGTDEIEAPTILGTTVGRWHKPTVRGGLNRKIALMAGAPAPPDWTAAGETSHPAVAFAISGLNPAKTYELTVTALDGASPPNESARQATPLQAQPLPSQIIVHVPKKLFVG